MFDTIKFKIPLDVGCTEFQTKDLFCTMDNLTVNEDGRLIHDEWHWEENPDIPDPNYPFMGCIIKVVDKKDVEISLTGKLWLTGYSNGGYKRYFAEFENGKFKKIDKISEEW